MAVTDILSSGPVWSASSDFVPGTSMEVSTLKKMAAPSISRQDVLGADTAETQPANRVSSVAALYADVMTVQPVLGQALRLLEAAMALVRSALDAARRDEWIAADLQIQQLQSMLPELYACRSIGDGFGAIVGALYIGLMNQEMAGIRASNSACVSACRHFTASTLPVRK